MYSGKLVRLRSLELTDLEQLMKHINEYEVRRYLTHILPFSRSFEEEWLKKVQHPSFKDGISFAIERLEDKQLVGTIGLHRVDEIHRTAIIGIAVYKPYLEKGYGTEAMRLILWLSFHQLNLHRLELEVVETNHRAIHVYKKIGFKEVGRKRQAFFREGKYHDVILMDLLKEEWQAWFPREITG